MAGREEHGRQKEPLASGPRQGQIGSALELKKRLVMLIVLRKRATKWLVGRVLQPVVG